MLKYLLAAATFVIVLFLSVSAVVLTTKTNVGMLGNIFVALSTLGATRAVYRYFKKREEKAEFEKEIIPVITNDDKLKFERSFSFIDCEAAEISEVIVMVGDEGIYSYKVGMRTPQFDSIEPHLTREELYKFFPIYTKFDFVDLNNESMAWRFVKGTRIKIALAKQSPAI